MTIDLQRRPEEIRKPVLRDYWRVLYKRRWYALLFVGLVVSSVLLYTLRQVRIYRASTTVHIELSAPEVLGQGVEDVVEVGSSNYWSDKEYYETQYRVIRSRVISERVAKRLGLQHNPDFMGVEKEKRSGWRGASIADAARVFQSRVTVEPVRDSRLVEVQVDDPDPRRATLLANTLTDVYIQHNLEYKLSSTIQALDWLSQQLDQLRGRLEESEMALHRFKLGNNILSVSLEDRRNILANEMERLTISATDARTRRVELQARMSTLGEVRDRDPLELPSNVLVENETLAALKQTYAGLAEEQAGAAARYGENHPIHREATAKLASLRETIGREVRLIIESISQETRAARQTETELDRLLQQSQEEALALNLHEIEYNRLARERTNNEEIYGLLLKRTKETDLSRLLQFNNIRVLDTAEVPRTPIKPRVSFNLALALIVGLLGGIGLAFVVEYLDNTIKSKDDIEAGLGLTFLGLIPRIGGKATKAASYGIYGGDPAPVTNGKGPLSPDTFVSDHPKSAVAECLRSIRTNLLFISPEKPLRTILVTSSAPQEGKTSTSVNMAITMAQGGNRTILVDTDMRRPRLHRVFGSGTETGLSSVIIGGSNISDSIRPTGIENLFVLPCGPIPPNPAELLHTDGFRNALSALTETFDRVVLDSPPVTLVTDAAIIGTMVDGVVVVVRNSKTPRELALQVKGQLQGLGARILGVVLNDVDLSRRGGDYYYYYDQYYRPYAEDQKRAAELPPADSRH